jgi:hypothetical protein
MVLIQIEEAKISNKAVSPHGPLKRSLLSDLAV